MIGEQISPSPEPQPSLLDRSLGALVRVNRETVAWTVLIVLAVVSRLYHLGARAMSHDESLHAVYSLDLYRNGVYEHNPMMHGPFQFHINALVYFLFGVSDATTRLAPALAGIGVVVMAWFFRRWIGRTGALLAGLFLLLSPSLLFHSRYVRNDIYIAFFGMIWIYGLFRYLEKRRGQWLYLMVAAMALGFATKENQFMTGVIFGVFIGGSAFWRMWKDGEPLTAGPFGDLAVLMLTLVLPFTTPFGYLLGQKLLGWEAVNWTAFVPTTTLIARFSLLVLLMTALSIGIAYVWYGVYRAHEKRDRITFGGWAALMLTFWAIEIVFFTTFFTNPLKGLATGVVGSLGYWLAQQAVERGSQPWYYYILQGLLYEFLPLLLSMGGAVAVVRGLGRKQWEPTPELAEVKGHRAKGKRQKEEAATFGALSGRTVRVYFVLFLFWWVVAAWIAYSYAGEKMPWLMTHIAQPMAIFGGWWLGRLFGRIDWKRVRENNTLWLLALLPALVFALATLIASWPPGGRGVDSLARTVRFVFAFFVSGGLFYLGWIGVQRCGWRSGLRLAVVGVAAILFLLTVRFSYLLTYVNYDMATEYLVYAHGTPDIKRALAEIETISERTVGDHEIRVAYDDDVAWPMTWYMRFYPQSLFYGASPNTDSMSAPIILVGSKNYDKVEPYVARDYVSRTYRLIWWPEESYKGEWDAEAGRSKGLTLAQVWGALTDPVRRARLWQIFFYRNHPNETITQWPNRHEFRMYVRKDIADIVWDLNVTPTETAAADAPVFDYRDMDISATTVYGGLYGGTALLTPRALTVGPDGRRYLVDTGNNRIVVLAPNGDFVRAFGSTCFLSDGVAGGCVDPDGTGPLQLGDGQFREPWGVAVAADGTIFVADTWNGRIQVFDNEGRFLRKWGVFNIIEGDNSDPFALFGPRGLAIAQNGDLLVADTGNKRILEYTPTGQYVRQVGGGGIILGRFEEPVDVAVDPRNGNVLVTDIWNQRIQVLSPELQPQQEWPMPTWESQDIWDKAYLAVDGDGVVYASDPQFAQVFVIDPDGTVQASFGKYGVELNRFAKPTGLAIDPNDGSLLVADADNNRVMVFSGVGSNE